MSTINIGGQEIPAIALAIGIPALAACYVAYDGYFAEGSLMSRYDSINIQIEEVATKQADADKLKQRAKEIDKVRAEIAEYGDAIKKLRDKIPGEAQVPVLLYDIERIAKSSHGDLATFQPGEMRSFSGGGGNDIQEMPVTISASATFPQVIAFMQQLNKYERKLSVSNLSLVPTGAKPDAKSGISASYQNTLKLDFTLNAYVLKDRGGTP